MMTSESEIKPCYIAFQTAADASLQNNEGVDLRETEKTRWSDRISIEECIGLRASSSFD